MVHTPSPLSTSTQPYARHTSINTLPLTPIVPTNISIWDWLFSPSLSTSSPLHRPASELGGFTDGVTQERLNWADVAQLSTYVCTALVRKYGLQQGQTVALFSRNTIWYPVMLFAALRAGE